MALSTADEATASNLGPQSNSNAGSSAASRPGTPVFRHSPSLPSTSFKAVNSRATSENVQMASPADASQQRAGSSDLTTPQSNAAVAHDAPQAAQSSTSAPHALKSDLQGDTLDAAMSETVYGTRSRNRTNARPNYAEDQDVDFDFSSAATTGVKKKGAESDITATQSVSESKRAPDALGATPTTENDANETASGAKELYSGTSHAAVVPSKKRKAAGGTGATAQAPALSSTPPPSTSRKSGASATAAASRETNIMTFTKHRNCLNKKGELIADDGTKLSVNDHVYLVCEPPGDPYYLCRIMEFLHTDSDNPNSPVDSLRVNWYYRPRDVQRFSSDTRLVYSTMHSDMCPVTSLRGKCRIRHRSEITDLDAYRKERDAFYFVQVFDRFIRRSYECIPVREIINVPEKVKKALDERWKFVVVEIGRVKELTSAAKTCKRCSRYCASNESVDCAICKNSYHMNCVQPPLPKKPSRGFAWACGPCSRASEKKMEARNTPTLSGNGTEAEDEEVVEEEEVPAVSSDTTRAPSPDGDEMMIDQHPATQAEIALAKMWPMRYLGIHARVEDALQYDDRAIYPRASSRLGPRHQANVNMWHGRPVELIKPAEIKKRYNKGPALKKEGKLTKETVAAMEADREERAKRPKWVQDEPAGYVPRGEDYDNKDPRCTAKLLYRMPAISEEPTDTIERQRRIKQKEAFVDDFLKGAKQYAKSVGVPPFGVNYIDKALELLAANKYNVDATIKQLIKVDRVKDLHEPVLTKSELIKFEEGVAKYGSEHRSIRLHMKTTLPHADIVRFYYLWKKTPKGREIWGNYGGRKKRKLESDAGAKLQAEVANDMDDSAFDNEKAARKTHGFQCKFCHTSHSRQWRRAPGVSPGQLAAIDKTGTAKEKKERPLLALCLRCAGLWRKYAIQWEDADEIAKKVASGGSKALKRRIDEELLREIQAANEAASALAQDGATLGALDGSGEPPKKKSKSDKDASAAAIEAQKKKEKPAPPPKEPTPPPPPIIPAEPTWRDLPCAVCKGPDNTITCQHCKLTVHRQCFGLRDNESLRANGDVKWICEQCQNDRNPTVSTDYSCCLCLTEETLIDLVEPPRVSHKKKTDREREKERLEKELADAMRADYRSKQLALNRPPLPREPLKRTTGNNWVHVYCAIWVPEIRFSDAKAMEVAEGLQMIPQSKFETICKLCKNKDHQSRVREHAGACINCAHCNAAFHVSCAFEAGYQFGFDVQPVKGSRKDQVTTATLGQETGALTAVVLCKDHVVKSIVHPVSEVVDDVGTTALQVFVQNYKQADLTLTGTVRKAVLAQLSKDKAQQISGPASSNSRRESGAHSIAAAVRRGARTSSVAETKIEAEEGNTGLSNTSDMSQTTADRQCKKCKVDVTPRWHLVARESPQEHRKSQDERPASLSGELGETERGRENGTPSVSQLPDPSRQQNIRFMAPGANGRAWDGMHERYGARPIVNGDHYSNEAVNGTPHTEPRAQAEFNGDHRVSAIESERRAGDDAYHNHFDPQYRHAARNMPPLATTEDTQGRRGDDYLCHKCFLKRKLDPTPPPEDRSSHHAPSSPHQNRGPLDWARGSQPPQPPSIDQQFRLWDDPPPPPQAQVPPPPPGSHTNGMGPPPPGYESYGSSHPPLPPGLGYPLPHYGPQSNGYHVPPQPSLHDGGPPAPHYGPSLPSLHERHNSYGYPHQSSPVPPQYASPGPHAPAMNGYAQPPQHHMSQNGMQSQHSAAPPPRQSPSYALGPPSHSAMPHLHAEPQYPASLTPGQLPPIGPPRHSNYGPSDAVPPSQQQQQQQETLPPPPAPMPSDGRAQSPTTPRGPGGGQSNGSGASASPNLNYLIH